MAVEVNFSVKVDTLAGQHVRVVGEHKLLGSWNPQMGFVMDRESKDPKCDIWTASVHLEKDATFNFRFCICKSFTNKGELKKERDVSIIVCKWETNVRPRQFSTHDCGDHLKLMTALFGSYDHLTNVGKGWLMDQCEVQIRLHSDPIHMWKAKDRQHTYSVKCIAVDYSGGQDPEVLDEDSFDEPPACTQSDVFVSNLAQEDCEFALQGQTGMIYHPGEYIVFRIQTMNPCHIGYQLEFYVCDNEKCPRSVGTSHLLPLKFSQSQVKQKLPIIGKNKPIGEVQVELLIARPITGLDFNMATTYQTQWRRRPFGEGSLNIGHRGMGMSYSNLSKDGILVKENTIASFDMARKHGADLVEFDVILSKDREPVVYHDFSVNVCYRNKKKHAVETEMFQIPVQNLTRSQLQSMKLFVVGNSGVGINDEDVEMEDTEPFPTLVQCLQDVDIDLGFNIEIKYPQQDVNDVWEEENYIDINENLDHILSRVFAHAGCRKIVFSSFDADTCILLQLKQNYYPVLFLHQGQTSVFTQYKDFRANTFRNGISFALSEQLLGLALHTEVLLRDLSLIQWITSKSLVVWVWGEDNNDSRLIRMLRHLNVEGIIYDRIDRHKPEHQLDFHLEASNDFNDIHQLQVAFNLPSTSDAGETHNTTSNSHNTTSNSPSCS